MAHYDCSNCGAYGGVDFGFCRSCTPREYGELTSQRGEVLSAAKEQWERENKALLDRLEEVKKTVDDARKKGVARIAKAELEQIDEKLHAIQMEHHHSYRNRHEREAKNAG